MNRRHSVITAILLSVLLVTISAVSADCCYGPGCQQPYYNNPCYCSAPNCATFVSDVSYADGSYVAPGTAFTKTWRIRNSGTSTWTTNYQVVFYTGTQMSAPSFVYLPYTVYPGQTVDISVPMVAPTTAGTFKGEWLLKSDQGELFGIGSNCRTAFWVQISTQVVYTQPIYYGPCNGNCGFNWRPEPDPCPYPGSHGSQPCPHGPQPGPYGPHF